MFNRAYVFQEVNDDEQVKYLHYCLHEDGKTLVPQFVLDALDHWQLVEAD